MSYYGQRYPVNGRAKNNRILGEYGESHLEEGKLASVLKLQGSVFQNDTGRGVHIHFLLL